MMYGNSRGQVGVVVAILMVSLVVAVIVIIQVYYVPTWMKEKEAEHMDTVANQFSNLKFSIDLQTLAQIDVPITNSITLGSKELPYFISARAFGSLNVLPPANSNFTMSLTANGKELRSFSESDITLLTDVADITAFELVLDTLENGDIYNVSIDGMKRLEVQVIGDGPYRIDLETINDSTIFDQPIATELPMGTQGYRINLLNPDYKFVNQVLPYIDTPFDISVNSSTSNGEFDISGHQYQNATISFSTPNGLGTIQYQSENAYFVDQTYTYQGGAVIISQSDGNAITSPPFFSASNATTQHVFNMSLVDVRGLPGKRSAGGYGTYAIRTNYSSTQYLEFKASSVTLTITTDYPEAWERYLNTTLTASGMQQDVDYNLTIENHQLVVLLYGPSVDSADITFSLQKITVYAQVGPGWVS
ncbi:MAG: DUF7289 family protein [Thermoplasmatota archaeon]